MKTDQNKQLGLAAFITGLLAVLIIILALGVEKKKPLPQASAPLMTGSAAITLISPVGGTVDVGQVQHVTWTSSNYQPLTVSVQLLKKISDNPARYELVRTIASSKKNNGEATWVPAKTDVGGSIYVQVSCANTAQACTAGISGEPLAVVDDGRYANTASAYAAIEASENQ